MTPVASIGAMRAALQGTPMEGRALIELPVLDTGEVAYAIPIAPDEIEALWKIARALYDQTGRYPLASGAWGGGPWQQSLQQGDLFSRFYYEEVPQAGDVSPRALIRRADSVDVDAWLVRLSADYGETFTLQEALDLEREATLSECGIAPDEQELVAATVGRTPVSSQAGIDRWLLDWEEAHGVPKDPARFREPWFDGIDNLALLFLPISSSWDALAYLSWYGAVGKPAECSIALGRRWEQRFGAELVAHFGTMLQCQVARPPLTRQEAWPLAREHQIEAECTLALPGFALRHYALGLVGHGRWFLHQRP